ncbi:MAG: lipid-A-disaccharide synthase N-terminal domain-containing protein [Bacteroidales bacterium]
MGNYYIFALGFAAQLFFSARILIQWIMSEKAKRVISPSIFWELSILASYMLFLYGWFRNDFAIMLGQVITYYIYIWNLREKKDWKKFPALVHLILNITPIAGMFYILFHWQLFFSSCFKNADIPILLLLYGSAGQLIFTLRFVYQYFYSHKRNESLLPKGFWIISIIGSATIVSYGILRADPVIILGQSFGFVSYIRNLILLKKSHETNRIQ